MAKRASELRAWVEAAEHQLESKRAELVWYEDGLRLFGDGERDPEVEPPLPGFAGDSANEGRNGSERASKPSLRNAILAIMREQPTKSRKVESVIAELRRRDWLPGGENGEHHTRSMMAQMHRKGQLRRVDRGRYRLPPEPKDDS